MDDNYKSTAKQFLKFAVVGLINTAVDFVILNILSAVTGITSGNGLIPINIVSFTIATSNSYFLNKRWSFHDLSHAHEGRKFSLFLMVSVVGAVINTTIVKIIATNVDPMFGFGDQAWLNAAKVCATAISLIWNFIGYKWVVFKK